MKGRNYGIDFLKSFSMSKIARENNIHKKPFGYSLGELERKAAGEKVFPHVFGTDKYGRDIMVRVMIGTRVSLLVGIFAALLVLFIGTVYGLISGFSGGGVDMRYSDDRQQNQDEDPLLLLR